MWSTLALTTAVALAPAQAGSLKLDNVRVTYALLGAERPNSKLLPGDMLFVSFDIDNLKVGSDGEVQYSMGMQLTNSDGKVQYKKEPKELKAFNSLGGTRLPAFAMTEIGMDTPAGSYTLTVNVTDLAAKAQASLVRQFDVLPMEFGFVRFSMTFDPDLLMAAPPLGVPGQTLYVSYCLVGFELDKKKQPNLYTELKVLDESDRPTLTKPLVGEVPNREVPEVPEKFKKILPMQFPLQLNRPGRFKLELTAKDKVSGKTSRQYVPFVVVDPAAK